MPYSGPGLYQHFKGDLYRVHGLVLLESDLEPHVLYEPNAPSTSKDVLDRFEARGWIRLLTSFDEMAPAPAGLEMTMQEAQEWSETQPPVPRFVKIG